MNTQPDLFSAPLPRPVLDALSALHLPGAERSPHTQGPGENQAPGSGKEAWAPSVKVARNARPTSRAAAAAAYPTTGAKRCRIYERIVNTGARGASDSELEAYLGIPGNTVRPRRKELLDAGLIRDSGETRRTISGSAATVWLAV